MAFVELNAKAKALALAATALVSGGMPTAAMTFNDYDELVCADQDRLAYVGEDVAGQRAIHLTFDARAETSYQQVLAFNARSAKATWYSTSGSNGLRGRGFYQHGRNDHAGLDDHLYIRLQVAAAHYPGRGQIYGNRSVTIVLVENIIYWPECVSPATLDLWKAAAEPAIQP